jgi:hypothetical protein
LLSLLLALPATAATIMVVDSYADDFAWVRNYQRGLREVLRQHQLISIALDTKKIPPSQCHSVKPWHCAPWLQTVIEGS